MRKHIGNCTFRIYTEDRPGKRRALIRAITKAYPGFTVYRARGYWRAQAEKSLIIEICTGTRDVKRINDLARKIKTLNKQEAVLVQIVKNENYIV